MEAHYDNILVSIEKFCRNITFTFSIIESYITKIRHYQLTNYINLHVKNKKILLME